MNRPRSLSVGNSVLALSGLILATSVFASGQRDEKNSIVGSTAKTHATLIEPMLDQYCSRCHNDFDLTAGLSVSDLRAEDLQTGRNAEQWEKILRRMAAGEMPPHGKPQPDPAQRAVALQWIANSRARYVAANPDPGRSTIRRLNRVEYANAVRDLLRLDIDFSQELPQDNSGFGFDNIADVLTVSPTLMERYIAVAGKVSRLATGQASKREFTTSYQIPKDGSVMNSGIPAYNERSSAKLPLASRGGGSFRYFARYDGNYEIAAWLNSNTNNETDWLQEDRYSLRVPMKAGSHMIGLSFARQLWPDESVQTIRNTVDAVPLPLQAPKMLPLDIWVDGRRVNTLKVPSHRLHPRYSQQNFPRDVLQIDVIGPQDVTGISDTPSRRAIFTCHPKWVSQEESCALRIISALARRAWRRPVTAKDVTPLMAIYAKERRISNFEHGIEAAIEAILVSPEFLFAVETHPENNVPSSVYVISDLQLATRLSLFLWSSIPDDRLLSLAEQGKLRDPKTLDAEIGRMIADPKSRALVDNFAGQWLYLRNLDQQSPNITLFPQFDNRLRRAMADETLMFFAYVMQNNRPVLDFIESDYTFLNQRLASHYGISGVSGTAMRKVSLEPKSHRGGLLGQASILTVTSYGNHTSVVKRGKWVLDNMLASPPPSPPPDIPALKTERDGRQLTAREQLELHRANPTCAACHAKMDPIGFALENFDPVGAWRTSDAGQPIDADAVLPDGTGFSGLSGLQKILMDRRDEFTRALTERLMTYALARGLDPQDMPAVRAIATTTAADGYRIRTIIKGIITSPSFTLRKTPQRSQTKTVALNRTIK